MTFWYRAAIAVLDQPMIPITVRSGTPSTRSTVAAVCRASCSRPSRTAASFSSAFQEAARRNAVYGLGLIGALVYFWQQADSFGGYLLAILRALVWPAFLV